MKLDVKGWINKATKAIDNLPEVDSGTVDHSGFNPVTVAGQSSSYKTISFGKTFSAVPQVVVQEHNNSLNNYGGVVVSVSYVTTTGFNLYAHGVPNATLQGLAYDWIAVVGGVVHKLFKALKPLTLGRGWVFC